MSEQKLKTYAESIFVDSGAFSLHAKHVLKAGKREGKTGRVLDNIEVRWTQGDFSYYNLTKGSEFRAYCHDYAKFIITMRKRDPNMMFANIDAIGNPDLTWEIQQFFENEYGVQPIPIVHCNTPMGYVDRYLEAGGKTNELGDTGPKYDLIGVGGSAQNLPKAYYISWADRFFTHICPKSNKRLPLIRVHGFAMTSWSLLCRYPWWSVDSATWVKMSAYGMLYVPRFRNGKFCYNCPPMMFNFSSRSPAQKKTQQHYANFTVNARNDVDLWFKHCGLPMGSVDEKGEMVDYGLMSHYIPRRKANLLYLDGLQNSRPEWPYPLDNKVVQMSKVKYRKGYGL